MRIHPPSVIERILPPRVPPRAPREGLRETTERRLVLLADALRCGVGAVGGEGWWGGGAAAREDAGGLIANRSQPKAFFQNILPSKREQFIVKFLFGFSELVLINKTETQKPTQTSFPYFPKSRFSGFPTNLT